ncbi:hypothetical protein Goarm_022822, partial [Gossypium armourianum]|nr:hypothetical protein [Gossypium armourianum]
MLWDYADELILKNPGTLKRGRKEGCRPILGLDGCFLKGPFKGELLAVVGKNGNNQMYPVAWVIVKGECIDSWV